MKELDLIRKIVKQIDSITDHEITYRDVFDNTSSIVGTWSLRAGKETKAFWHPDNAKPSPTTEINVQSHHALPLQITDAQSQIQLKKEVNQALEKADTKLNTIYKKIMASKDVEAESKKNLRIAQRVWLQFVEAQINTLFPVKEGENPRDLYGSKAQLISQFPLREEEQKMPEAIYGPTYHTDHARAEIILIQQRIKVLGNL